MSNKLDILAHYINKDEPFGPIDAGDINSTDVDALNLLFERQNMIYKQLRERPSIIMGRRGSGKTSYLRTVLFDKDKKNNNKLQYDFYVEMRTANAFTGIARTVQGMTEYGDTVFVENLAELWERVLWTCMFSEIYQKLSEGDLPITEKFLEFIGIKKDYDNSMVLKKLADLFGKAKEVNPQDGISDILEQFNKQSFSKAKEEVTEYLLSKDNRFVILMDSVEDIHIDETGRALKGLLKCVGAMNKPRDVVDIRFCLPTELYPQIEEYSSNPNKDFRRALKIEWTAKELILIGAQRLTYFIQLYYPFLLKKSPPDILKYKEAAGLFHMVLPNKIYNQVADVQEDSISYILRHTQLLPRHFLMLLNSIFGRSNFNTQSLNPFPVSENKVIEGIRKVEARIVAEIFDAYGKIYHSAGQTCRKCLPELGHMFEMGDLERVFVHHGKSGQGKPGFDGSFFDFRQMLADMGAIGKVMPGSESGLYIKGQFGYAVGYPLTLGYADKLCVHPLFSGIFHDNHKKERPVYPYGCELDDKENEDD